VPNLRIRDAGREFTFQLEAEVTTIGRADTNVIEIQDSKASKEHCEILRAGQRWKVVDLESKNGTRVNGEYRNKAWLAHGDVIQIGTAEMRFGLEGAQRAPADAAAPASAARPRAATQGGRPPPPPPDDTQDEDYLPPSRRYESKKNLPLILSLSFLGLVVIFIVASKVAFKTQVDEYNMQVIEEANKLVGIGEYDRAVQYLREHGDPDGNAYESVEERIAEIRERKDSYERNSKELAARGVFSDLARKIKAYHAGKQSATPEEILALVEELKTKYPDTEKTADARREWAAWFAGKVPQRASELLAGGGRLDKDWEAAVAAADEFRKEWRFREARETLERFVTAREAVLDPEELERYRELRDRQIQAIDRLAESIYRGREQEANRLLKEKRYDQAIAIYREVIEKFGIDFYMRKAQQEIDAIDKLKTAGG